MRGRQDGFTIIEAVISVAIIAVGILILSYLYDSIKITRVAQNETVAVNFARRYLDMTKAMWQDPTFYDVRAMPQVAAPTNFSYTIKVDSETFTGGGVISPVVAGSAISTAADRLVKLTITTPNNGVVNLSTKITRPIVNQPPATVPITGNGGG